MNRTLLLLLFTGCFETLAVAQNCLPLPLPVNFAGVAKPCKDIKPVDPRSTTQPVKFIVIHTTQNPNPSTHPDGDLNEFLNNDAKSIHYVVNASGVWQMANESSITYHAGNDAFSSASIGIEHVAFCCELPKPRPNLGLDSADEAARLLSISAALLRNITTRLNIPATRITRDQVLAAKKDPNKLSGIIGHVDIPTPSGYTCSGSGGWGGKSCHTDPGEWDWSKFIALITGPPGDFNLSWPQYAIPLVPQGNSYTYSPISITGVNSFGFPITLSLSNLPPGVTGTFTPNTLPGPLNASVQSVLKIQTSNTTPTGNFNITITATGGGSIHTMNVPLSIVPGTGTIVLKARVNGADVSSSVATSYSIVGPSGIFGGSTIGSANPTTLNVVPPGQYRLDISGGPGSVSSITPSPTQMVLAGTTTTYVINFVQETVTAPRLSGPGAGLLNTSTAAFTATGALSSIGSPLVYDYEWADGTQTSGAGASASHAWNRTGSFLVKVRARSSRNSSIVSAYSNTVTIQIAAPPLSASCYFSTSTITLGSSTTMVGAASGGVSPYQFLWPGYSTYSSASSIGVTPTNVGLIGYQVTAKDSSGQTKSATCSVQVNGPVPSISRYQWNATPRNRVPFSGTIYGNGFLSGIQVFFCVNGGSSCYAQSSLAVNNSTTLTVTNVNLTTGNWQIYVKTQYGTSARSNAFYVAP